MSCLKAPMAPPIAERIKGTRYTRPNTGEVSKWDGRHWLCPHDRQRPHCIECADGSGFCKHFTKNGTRMRRQVCPDPECQGTEYCHKHNTQKGKCKECKGRNTCEHKEFGGYTYRCPICSPEAFCVHKVYRRVCKPCGGTEFCDHGKRERMCVECEGNGICKVCKVTQINPKYRPHCGRCHFYLNPDKVETKRFKTKENTLYQALSKEFGESVFVYNRKIDGGCSGRIPDFFFECKTHSVIVECDEAQHIGYGEECENKRMLQIFVDLGNRPLVMLRFNPDGYTKKNETRVPTCFPRDKPINQKEFDTRFKKLAKRVKHWLKTIPKREVTEEKFFFNETNAGRDAFDFDEMEEALDE